MNYFKVLLKTSDVNSGEWHKLTDPLIENYRSSKQPNQSAVLEIREFSGHSYRDYSDYLLEFIQAAHDGEIDLASHDPLTFQEWRESHKPSYENHLQDSSTENALEYF
ncbi:MAG: hypothetical protein H7249_19465 [Chitinophagaceae bacterium]|nr:hypothetical protein [Oligoflexus sp.]